MNLIPEIAKMLGVEIGEEFRIKDESGIDEDFHRFTDCSLVYYDQAMCEWQESMRILELIEGRAEVVKKPFEPKEGETYWNVAWSETEHVIVVCILQWISNDRCYADKYAGNCFRTEAEAEKHKYEIYEKLTGKKWEE